MAREYGLRIGGFVPERLLLAEPFAAAKIWLDPGKWGCLSPDSKICKMSKHHKI